MIFLNYIKLEKKKTGFRSCSGHNSPGKTVGILLSESAANEQDRNLIKGSGAVAKNRMLKLHMPLL